MLLLTVPCVMVAHSCHPEAATSTTVLTTVTFGANYKMGERLVMEIDRWERFPGYTLGDYNSIDLGVYCLKKPIPNFSRVTFVDAPFGINPIQVDFGNYGDTISGPASQSWR